jgi:hypothetical protein
MQQEGAPSAPPTAAPHGPAAAASHQLTSSRALLGLDSGNYQSLMLVGCKSHAQYVYT